MYTTLPGPADLPTRGQASELELGRAVVLNRESYGDCVAVGCSSFHSSAPQSAAYDHLSGCFPVMNGHCLHDEVFLGGCLLANIYSVRVVILLIITQHRIEQRSCCKNLRLINHMGDN